MRTEATEERDEHHTEATTVRWTPGQLRAVSDEAWRNRVPLSRYIRRTVIERLRELGIEA